MVMIWKLQLMFEKAREILGRGGASDVLSTTDRIGHRKRGSEENDSNKNLALEALGFR